MAKRRRRRKRELTPEQIQKREKRKLSGSIERVFGRTGFRFVKTVGREIEFDGAKTDFDQLHVCDGCVVLVEETCLKDTKAIRAHLNKKVLFHQIAEKDHPRFLQHLSEQFPELRKAIAADLDLTTFQVRVVYCTRYSFEKENRQEYEKVIFLRHEYLKHFLHLTRTIGQSARFELYKFLGLTLEQVRPNAAPHDFKYDGFVLPASRSGFGDDFKIVSFYMDPARLTELAYSLRRDSWMDSEGLYQRILSPGKIRKMRKFLHSEGHVYVNNIIVGLPADVRITDSADNDIKLNGVAKVLTVRVHLPARFNSIGLIDGQHRVFSYHEGSDSYEKVIAAKRTKQQLMVTGLIFPKTLSEPMKLKQEAKIFLEINAEQTSAKADLKQAIETIVRPYTSIAIAKSVMSYLAKKGALEGELHDHFYDDGVIKTSSIIAYGLRYLVDITDPAAKSSFISTWNRTKARSLSEHPSQALRDEFVKYCGDQIELIWNAFFANVPGPLRSARNKESRAFSVTMINGLLYCTRRLLHERRLMDSFEGYRTAFASHGLNLQRGKFRFKSSQWKSLGDALAKRCFGIESLDAPPSVANAAP